MKDIVAFCTWDAFYSVFTPLNGEIYWNKYKDSSQSELIEEKVPNEKMVLLIIKSLSNTLN